MNYSFVSQFNVVEVFALRIFCFAFNAKCVHVSNIKAQLYAAVYLVLVNV